MISSCVKLIMNLESGKGVGKNVRFIAVAWAVVKQMGLLHLHRNVLLEGMQVQTGKQPSSWYNVDIIAVILSLMQNYYLCSSLSKNINCLIKYMKYNVPKSLILELNQQTKLHKANLNHLN